jgi:hypothetical protein
VHTASIVWAMMEAVCTFEMLVFFNKTTLSYVPQGYHLHALRCENLKYLAERVVLCGVSVIDKLLCLANVCGDFSAP